MADPRQKRQLLESMLQRVEARSATEEFQDKLRMAAAGQQQSALEAAFDTNKIVREARRKLAASRIQNQLDQLDAEEAGSEEAQARAVPSTGPINVDSPQNQLSQDAASRIQDIVSGGGGVQRGATEQEVTEIQQGPNAVGSLIQRAFGGTPPPYEVTQRQVTTRPAPPALTAYQRAQLIIDQQKLQDDRRDYLDSQTQKEAEAVAPYFFAAAQGDRAAAAQIKGALDAVTVRLGPEARLRVEALARSMGQAEVNKLNAQIMASIATQREGGSETGLAKNLRAAREAQADGDQEGYEAHMGVVARLAGKDLKVDEGTGKAFLVSKPPERPPAYRDARQQYDAAVASKGQLRAILASPLSLGYEGAFRKDVGRALLNPALRSVPAIRDKAQQMLGAIEQNLGGPESTQEALDETKRQFNEAAAADPGLESVRARLFPDARASRDDPYARLEAIQGILIWNAARGLKGGRSPAVADIARMNQQLGLFTWNPLVSDAVIRSRLQSTIEQLNASETQAARQLSEMGQPVGPEAQLAPFTVPGRTPATPPEAPAALRGRPVNPNPDEKLPTIEELTNRSLQGGAP